MIRAELADGRILEFPDGTDDQVIQETVKKLSRQDLSLGQSIIGGAETAAGVISGAIAEPLSGIAGLAQSLNPFAGEGAGAKAVEATAEALSFAPTTEAGRAVSGALAKSLEGVSGFFNDLQQGVGDAAFNLADDPRFKALAVNQPMLKPFADNPALAGAAGAALPAAILELLGLGGFKKVKTARQAKRLIAEEIRKGNPNIDLVAKSLDPKGRVITNKDAKKAVNVLGGGDDAKRTVSLMEVMSPGTKRKVNQMLDIIEKGRKDARFAQVNRPTDVIGESLAQRARALARINRMAGEKIDKRAKALTGNKIDISDHLSRFTDDLRALGVGIDSSDGKFNLNFSESRFVGGGKEAVGKVLNMIKGGNIDANQLHKIKRFIDGNVNFGKGTDSAIAAESEAILKRLRNGIDTRLDENFPSYERANQDYAETIGVLTSMDNLAGKNIDLLSNLSNKSLGGKARRIASNAESRVPILQTIEQADKVLEGFGVKFKDNIVDQSYILGELERLFKIEPTGSFRGLIERGVRSSVSSQGSVVDTALQGLSKLREPSFEDKMSALKKLTMEQE